MKRTGRLSRHKSVRRLVAGTSSRPRLAIFRSSAHIYAQLIDDMAGKTVAEESDLKVAKKINKKERAAEVGRSLAGKAVKKGIKEVVFDRGGFLYHGRVAALAEGAREGGLKF